MYIVMYPRSSQEVGFDAKDWSRHSVRRPNARRWPLVLILEDVSYVEIIVGESRDAQISIRGSSQIVEGRSPVEVQFKAIAPTITNNETSLLTSYTSGDSAGWYGWS